MQDPHSFAEARLVAHLVQQGDGGDEDSLLATKVELVNLTWILLVSSTNEDRALRQASSGQECSLGQLVAQDAP